MNHTTLRAGPGPVPGGELSRASRCFTSRTLRFKSLDGPRLRFGVVAVALSVALGASCTSTTHVRPLEPGQHGIAVVGGGPITRVPGVGEIPLPNIALEGRHGIVHHLDVGYGVHALPALFGVAGVHVGGAYQLFDQPDVLVPALTVSEKLYGFTNLKDFFALSETQLIASWSLIDQLAYVGLSGDTSFNTPHLFLSPFAGLELKPGIDWLRIQLEARWLAPAVDQSFAVVDWQAPGDKGAIAVKGGITFVLGGEP